jgi:hypothetical protein
MNHTLKWRHLFIRELGCFLFGHNWKHSPRRRTKYFGMDVHEVPYLDRVGKGNYMWEDIAWWGSKCIRCRERTNEWPWYPWYKSTWWAFIDSFQYAAFLGGLLLFDKFYKRNWKIFIALIPIMVTGGLSQFWMHFDGRLPSTWWTGFAELREKLFGFLDDVP